LSKKEKKVVDDEEGEKKVTCKVRSRRSILTIENTGEGNAARDPALDFKGDRTVKKKAPSGAKGVGSIRGPIVNVLLGKRTPQCTFPSKERKGGKKGGGMIRETPEKLFLGEKSRMKLLRPPRHLRTVGNAFR